MATFTSLNAASGDATTSTSDLTQLVDLVQEDVSGSSTRRAYQVFVTGGIGPGVTSSLFQTVYDQDFSLQTSNAIMDMTIGLFSGSAMVTAVNNGTTDTNGKYIFQSQSLMMREKLSNYAQYSQVLLGNAKKQFYAPGIDKYDASISDNASSTGIKGDRIEQALFLNFRRLFARDEIKKETFAMRLFQSAAFDAYNYDLGGTAGRKVGGHLTGSGGVFLGVATASFQSNVARSSYSGSAIYADINASTRQLMSDGGEVGYIVNTSNTAEYVGLMFYDQGIAVLDMGKVFMHDQHMSGVISGMRAGTTTTTSGSTVTTIKPGQTVIGNGRFGNPNALFMPDFLVSGSLDNIIDHIATCRFGTGSLTSATFQNITKINSNIYFCRAKSSEYNYSSNPSYTDDTGNINVIDDPTSDQRTFTYITTVGLYDSANNLLAVAKLSRPIEKNDEKDLTLRVRLDF